MGPEKGIKDLSGGWSKKEQCTYYNSKHGALPPVVWPKDDILHMSSSHYAPWLLVVTQHMYFEFYHF